MIALKKPTSKNMIIWLLYPLGLIAGFVILNIFQDEPIFEGVAGVLPWIALGLVILIVLDCVRLQKRRD